MNFPGCFLIRLCEEGGKDGGSVVFEVGFVWLASRVAIDLNVSPVLAKLLSSEVRILSDWKAIWPSADMRDDFLFLTLSSRDFGLAFA